jgi:hypothetical protein
LVEVAELAQELTRTIVETYLDHGDPLAPALEGLSLKPAWRMVLKGAFPDSDNRGRRPLLQFIRANYQIPWPP